jgi:hypothetical protein
MNYARRQQYRRAFRASQIALTSAAAAVLGLYLVVAGAALSGLLLPALAVMLGLWARHWLSLAARSRVGARSEDEVRRALDPRLRKRAGGCVIRSCGQAEGTSTRW